MVACGRPWQDKPHHAAPASEALHKKEQWKGGGSENPPIAQPAWRTAFAVQTAADPGIATGKHSQKTPAQKFQQRAVLHVADVPIIIAQPQARFLMSQTNICLGGVAAQPGSFAARLRRPGRIATRSDPAPVATLCDQNGTSSLEEMKRATTFFTPAFSKATSNLSPSMPVIAPYPNFWWNTRSPSVKLEVAVRSIT